MKKIKTLFLVFALIAIFEAMQVVSAENISGNCGNNLTWVINENGLLTINGEGEMKNISSYPWSEYSSSVNKIVINDGITSISHRAFANFQSLSEITIPTSVTNITDYAFYNCKNLLSINIPINVNHIGSNTFLGCEILSAITVDYNNTYFTSDEFGVLYNKDKTTLIKCPEGICETIYRIPDDTVAITEWAFYKCKNLKDVFIPRGVYKIGEHAFYSCNELKQVVIQSKYAVIGSYCFRNCTQLSILGYKNSTAETYSLDNNILFTLIKPQGDINGDYIVTSDDIKEMCFSIACNNNLSTNDLNLDGLVNIKDLNKLSSIVNSNIKEKKRFSNFDSNADYVIILDDKPTTVSSNTNGVIEKEYYLKIYEKGEIKSVKVKNINQNSAEYDKAITPETNKVFDCEGNIIDTDDCGFALYADKIARAVKNSNQEYYFELLDFTIYNDINDLKSKNTSEYRAQNVITSCDIKGSSVYDLDHASNTLRGVWFRDYTKFIIKSKNENGEWIFTDFLYSEAPLNIREGTVFENVSYVLIDNPSSTNYENLAFFYGTYNGVLKPYIGDICELRIVKTSKLVDSLYVYDVFNPINGTIESNIYGVNENLAVPLPIGSIVGLTTNNYINDMISSSWNIYSPGQFYDIEEVLDEVIDDLGYVEVVQYDTITGDLIVSSIDSSAKFKTTTDTFVSFSDKSDESFSVVELSALDPKTSLYKKDDNPSTPLRAFLCVELDENTYDQDLYIIKFAVIVRD